MCFYIFDRVQNTPLTYFFILVSEVVWLTLSPVSTPCCKKRKKKKKKSLVSVNVLYDYLFIFLFITMVHFRQLVVYIFCVHLIYEFAGSMLLKIIWVGVPILTQWKGIWLASMRLRVQSLASISGLRIHAALSCGVGCRCSLDPELLWLWRRPAATAPIRPLAWEPPFATGVALKRPPPKKKKERKKGNIYIYVYVCVCMTGSPDCKAEIGTTL